MFNEKDKEWSAKQGKEIPVWKSPKYEESKGKAIDIISSKKYGITESDFWILMNETKSGKMAYTGVIISHNGCLKINDALSEKFSPASVSLDKDGYNGSLVFTYCNDKQGIYEVGEVSKTNCKNEYPYAMAYKRLFDRVVLKLSKIAFFGIYSETEADEFREKIDADEKPVAQNPKEQEPETPHSEAEMEAFVASHKCAECGMVIVPYTGENGKEVSVERYIARCEKRFGKTLCIDCINKMRQEDEAPNNAE